MRRKQHWRIAAGVLAAAAIVCFCIAGWSVYQRRAAEQAYAALREETVEIAAPTLVHTEPPEGPTIEEILSAPFEGYIDAEETKIPPEVFTDVAEAPVNFDWLAEVNAEIYAWIYIPDTQINYPIAQHEGADQFFYLNHDFYGNPQFCGCIFSQEPNALDFSDPVTVLYGHNMLNGSMFQNLYFYIQDPEFFNDHKYIYIYMRDETLVYEVISAYYSDNRNILTTHDFSNPTVFADYLEECRNPRTMERHVREDVSLDSDSRILTLSTCRSGAPAQRYLVQAELAYRKQLT